MLVSVNTFLKFVLLSFMVVSPWNKTLIHWMVIKSLILLWVPLEESWNWFVRRLLNWIISNVLCWMNVINFLIALVRLIAYLPGTSSLPIPCFPCLAADLYTLLSLFSSQDMRRDIQEIFRATPHEKQVMMFSATLSKEIRPVCRKFCQSVSHLLLPPPNPRESDRLWPRPLSHTHTTHTAFGNLCRWWNQVNPSWSSTILHQAYPGREES